MIKSTDDTAEVEIYMSSAWMYRRNLSTKTSYMTYVSLSEIRAIDNIAEIGVNIMSQ